MEEEAEEEEVVDLDSLANRFFKIDEEKYNSEEFIDAIPKKKNQAGEILGPIRTGNVPSVKLTHLIVTDDLPLLKKKIETLRRGYLIMNGTEALAPEFCYAMSTGLPVFLIKYSGGLADLAVQALEKADDWLKKKRANPKARPVFPHDTAKLKVGYHPADWQSKFDESTVEIAEMMNVFLENFPSKYNPASVLQIDLFGTTEEMVQDKLTATLAVAFDSLSTELGQKASEVKRLTYAWRLRHKLKYNAIKQETFADLCQILMTFFTLCATLAAVVLTYLQVSDPNLNYDTVYALTKLNLVLPLAITIVRGVYAAMDPYGKFTALSLGYVYVESEIYHYRTKSGRYSPKALMGGPPKSDDDDKKEDDKKGDEKGEKKSGKKKDDKEEDAEEAEDEDEGKKARTVFHEVVQKIWEDIEASALLTGAIHDPPNSHSPVDDINVRLNSNLRHQRLLTEGIPAPRSGFAAVFPCSKSKKGSKGCCAPSKKGKKKKATGSWCCGPSKAKAPDGDDEMKAAAGGVEMQANPLQKSPTSAPSLNDDFAAHGWSTFIFFIC